jgi:hypothetical protein
MSVSFKLGDNGAEGKLKVNGFGSCKLVPYGVLSDFDSKFDDKWTTTKENEDWEDFIDWNSQVDQIKDVVYSFIPNDYFTKTQINSANYVREGDLIGSYSSVTEWAGAFATNEKAAAAYTLAVDASYTDLNGNTVSAVSGIQLGAIAGYDNTSSYMDFMADSIRFFATSARIVDEETGELTPATIEVDDVDKVAKSPTYENGEPMPAFGMLAEPDGQGGYQYKTYFNGHVVFLDGANSGSTLIKGGYINTDLVETDKLIVGASNTARHFGSWSTGDDEQDGDDVMQDTDGQLTASEVEQRNPTYGSITFRNGDTYFNTEESANYVYDGSSGMWNTTKGEDGTRGSVRNAITINYAGKGDDYLDTYAGNNVLTNAILSLNGINEVKNGDTVFWSNINDGALSPASGEAVYNNGWLTNVVLQVHGDAIVNGTLDADDIQTGTLKADFIELDADYITANGTKVSLGPLTESATYYVGGNASGVSTGDIIVPKKSKVSIVGTLTLYGTSNSGSFCTFARSASTVNCSATVEMGTTSVGGSAVTAQQMAFVVSATNSSLVDGKVNFTCSTGFTNVTDPGTSLTFLVITHKR